MLNSLLSAFTHTQNAFATRKAGNKYCQGELTIINFLVIFKDVSLMICLDINKQKKTPDKNRRFGVFMTPLSR